jgi:hypothetical protein
VAFRPSTAGCYPRRFYHLVIMTKAQAPHEEQGTLSRRDLLLGAASATGVLALNSIGPVASVAAAGASPRPGKSARRIADGAGTIDGLVRSGPLEVRSGRTLRFDPKRDTALEVTGNLVVRGRLEMKPEPGVEHVLRFVDVDESAFVGGGLDPLDTDVGLWVMEEGVLDVRGTSKRAWNRSGASGSWDRRDELVAAPVAPGDFEPTSFALGDRVPKWEGRRAEVLNLTRNVRIEGTPGGRAHVFIRSMRPQRIRNATLRHLGPRQPDGEYTASVLGRYGLHFHHCHKGSAGSLVEGVVIRDCGAHAFVPHLSHGITFRDCIAYDVFDEAYWWDPHDRTNDLLIDRCVAGSVHFDPDVRGFRLAAFLLGLGNGMALRRCVAFAVHGSRTSSGYSWPEIPSGVWTFRDNLAHNNVAAGIFVWQNVEAPHLIRRFTAYNNGEAGVIHGAYSNSYHYRDLDLTGQEIAVRLSASGRPDRSGRPQSWVDVRGGRLIIESHGLASQAPALFLRCSFAGGVTVNEFVGHPGAFDFVECGLEPDGFRIEHLNPRTVIRVQRGDGSAFELTAAGVRDIHPFYPY